MGLIELVVGRPRAVPRAHRSLSRRRAQCRPGCVQADASPAALRICAERWDGVRFGEQKHAGGLFVRDLPMVTCELTHRSTQVCWYGRLGRGPGCTEVWDPTAPMGCRPCTMERSRCDLCRAFSPPVSRVFVRILMERRWERLQYAPAGGAAGHGALPAPTEVLDQLAHGRAGRADGSAWRERRAEP